jgi:hypothetical protein
MDPKAKTDVFSRVKPAGIGRLGEFNHENTGVSGP